MKAKWQIVVPDPAGLCEACGGSGSHWPKRADGKPDRRYHWPVGPCPSCDGRRGYDTPEAWAKAAA